MTKKKAFSLIHGMLAVAGSRRFSAQGLAIVAFIPVLRVEALSDLIM